MANTVADGCLCSFMGAFSFYIIRNAICSKLRYSDVVSQSTAKIIRSINYRYLVPGWNIYTLFSKCHYVDTEKNVFEISFMKYETLIPCAILLTFSILCFVGMCVLSKSKRNERIGEISDSWFSYKLLIPFWGIVLATMINVNNADRYIYTALLLSLMSVGYVIYRRGFKLHRSDIIMIAITAVISMIDIRL
jgi:hypothetical protein